MATSATLPLTILGRTVWPEHYFEEHDGFDSVGPYRHADILAIPEEYRLELITGHLVMSPAPHSRHQILIGEIYVTLYQIARQHGGVVLMSPLDLQLADDLILQPDLVYLAANNRAQVADQVQGIPDLVIEVLSPTSMKRDQQQKFRHYESHGVPEYWVFDPAQQTAQFWLLVNGRYQLAKLDPTANFYQSALSAELKLPIAEIWQEYLRQTNRS